MLSPPSMSHSSRKTWRGLPFHFSLSMRFPSFRTHFLSTLLWQRNTSFSMHHSRTTRSGTKVLKVRSDVKMKRAGRAQWLARIRARLRKAPVTCGWDPFTVARGRLVLSPRLGRGLRVASKKLERVFLDLMLKNLGWQDARYPRET